MTPDALRDYVAGTILPAMGLSGRPFELSAPPEAGTRSSLQLIRAEGMPPLLMRTFDHHGQAARNAGALRHLDELGLPAPRLVYHDLSRRTRLMPGEGRAIPYVTAETWIEGTRHASLDDPATARPAALKVARMLARYHEVTRATWGRPSRPMRGRFVSFASFTLAGVRRMSAGLASKGRFSPDQARLVQERFASWRSRIAELSPYHLVHNDANRHNFVVTPAGGVVPVDLHRLAYEPFPEEVVNALYHFCRKDAALAAEFQTTYFESAGETARSVFETTRGFFEPLNYLKKCAQRAARCPDAPADDPKMTRWRDIVLGMEGPR